jgi:hypothetical protein
MDQDWATAAPLAGRRQSAPARLSNLVLSIRG